MRIPLSYRLLFAALLAFPAVSSAQGVALRPASAVYMDLKEVPLRTPEGVACTEKALVVADTGRGRLVTFELRNGAVIGGTEVKAEKLPYPTALQFDSKGNIVALDGRRRTIVRLDAKGTFVGDVEVKGLAGSPVIPAAFKLDERDNIYVLDITGPRVLVLDPLGNVTRQVPVPKNKSFTDITVDAAGTIFGMDGTSAMLWSADKTASEFKTLSASLKDRMNYPGYLLSSRGRIYAVDEYGMGIVVLGTDGSFLGRTLSLGWNEGLVYYPNQICISGQEIYVADRGNNRVQQFTFSD